MSAAHFVLAVPDDPKLLDRLVAELRAQSDPKITVARSPTAMLSFSCDTGEMLLRSRVVQAIEAALGPDGQRIVRTVGG